MTDNLDEDHSSEMSRRVAAKTAKFREIFIPYPKHTAIQERFEYVLLLGRAQRGRPQKGIRVLAETGSGKTKAGKLFRTLINQRESIGPKHLPVLYIQLERHATARKLYISLLDEMGDSAPDRGTEQALKRRVLAWLRMLGVELIIIDEVQHLVSRGQARNDITDALKVFLDSGVAPIVFLGTEVAEAMFRRDLQLSGRLLPPCDLFPLDRSRPEDRQLLFTFVEQLNRAIVHAEILAEPGKVCEPRTLGCLHDASKGVIGRVASLFEVAIEIALRRGATRVETYDLALAVDRWAIPQGFVDVNPFRQSKP
jgi:hypothetical protein